MASGQPLGQLLRLASHLPMLDKQSSPCWDMGCLEADASKPVGGQAACQMDMEMMLRQGEE